METIIIYYAFGSIAVAFILLAVLSCRISRLRKDIAFVREQLAFTEAFLRLQIRLQETRLLNFETTILEEKVEAARERLRQTISSFCDNRHDCKDTKKKQKRSKDGKFV